MKKRLISVLLILVMAAALLPTHTSAIGSTYGHMPIYIGEPTIDYMAEQILKEIPTAGKNDTEKIRAVYDWIILNCSRYDWDGTYYFDEERVSEQSCGAFREDMIAGIENGTIVCRQDLNDWSFDSDFYLSYYAYEMMMQRTGNCVHFSALLALLLGHLGYDCRIIDGVFLNRSGTTPEHKWNCVLVNGQYYWLDVRIDHENYTQTGKVSYTYFMVADTSTWEKKHSWDHDYSDWLFQNAAAIADSYTAQSAVAVGGPWCRCSDWAKEIVTEAGECDLIPDSLYGEDLTKSITRQEFAEIAVNLYALLGCAVKEYDGANPFTDTDDKAILTAYGLGIVNGVGNGRFAPDKTLTREQAVTMLGRVFELVATGTVGDGSALLNEQTEALSFADTNTISTYAVKYITFFTAHGIINGVGNHKFAAKNTMTREQAIKVAMKTVTFYEENCETF